MREMGEFFVERPIANILRIYMQLLEYRVDSRPATYQGPGARSKEEEGASGRDTNLDAIAASSV